MAKVAEVVKNWWEDAKAHMAAAEKAMMVVGWN